jgi:hypothetical protein
VETYLYTNTHVCVGGTADIISVDIAMVQELREGGGFLKGVFDAIHINVTAKMKLFIFYFSSSLTICFGPNWPS